MSKYTNVGLTLSASQLEKVVTAVKNHEGVSIRIDVTTSGENAPHKIPLTASQISQMKKVKKNCTLKLSAAQLKYLEKSGGFLPLLALLPLLFSGLAAAGGIAGGVSAAVSSANNAKAAAAAQTELERHNREVEAELKSGSGIVSDRIEHLPIIGKLAPYLRKIGLGINDCRKVLNNNECVCTRDGLQVERRGNGLYLSPSGNGLFLGAQR
jgi:hypothetical protein